MRIALLVVAPLAVALAGCGDSSRPSASDREPPTFTNDVAPIVFEHCAPCHRPGRRRRSRCSRMPTLKSRTDKIAHATLTRHMPPWLPAAGEPAFVGERRVAGRTDRDDPALGRRPARSKAMPAIFRRPRCGPRGGVLGKPDVVLRSLARTRCRPAQDDVYRNLVLPLSIPSTRFVRAVEFLPGDAPVHHAVIHLDRTSGSRRRDGADGHPGFDGMGGPGAQDPDGHFVGWAPGRGPIVAPPAMPWRLDAGTDIVLELHLLPGKTPAAVRPSLALFFTDQPPTASRRRSRWVSRRSTFRPAQRDYAITDTLCPSVDVDLLSVYPHAHFLGK